MTMLDHKPSFTIFTASYNRAHTLPKLFSSLLQQDFADFEWIVVDDGSTDSTADVIAAFQATANFPIRYLNQRHQGKMRAHNSALKYSQGELFLNVDSDDYLFPETLSRLKDILTSLPQDVDPPFAGISTLSVDPKGNIIGTEFDVPVLDGSYDEILLKGIKKGDCFEFWHFPVLKQFPYPEIEGEHFIPDGLIYHQISREYRVRFINEPLQVVVYQPDGISKNSILYRSLNPQGPQSIRFGSLNQRVHRRAGLGTTRAA